VALHCDILEPEETQLDCDRADDMDDAITPSNNSNLIQLYTVPPSPNQSSKRNRPVSYCGVSQRALIDVDRRRIAHVLRNLVSNALNFTPTGGEVTISVRLSSKMGPKTTSYSRSSYQRMISRDSQPMSRSSNHELEMGRSRNSDIEMGRSRNNDMGRSRNNEVEFKVDTDGDGASAESQSNSDKLICEIAGNTAMPTLRAGMKTDGTTPSSFSRGSNVSRGASVYFAAITPPDTTLHPMSSASTTVASTGEILLPPPPMVSAPTSILSGSGRDTVTSNSNLADRKFRSGTATPRIASEDSILVEQSKLSTCTKWLKGNICSNKKDKDYNRTKKKGLCYLIVEVTDTGSGIAKENLDRIFKEIVQFNPNELHGGGHGGSGLGMVLSKGIVEAHGGKLWLTSEGLGKGCTFGFGLPLSKNEALPDLSTKTDGDYIAQMSEQFTEGQESPRPRARSLDHGMSTRNFHSSIVAALTEIDSTSRPAPPSPVPRSEQRNSLRAHLSRVASFQDIAKKECIDRFKPDTPRTPGSPGSIPLAMGAPETRKRRENREEQKEEKNSVSSVSAESAAPVHSNTDYIPDPPPRVLPKDPTTRPISDPVPRQKSFSNTSSNKDTPRESRTRSTSNVVPRHALIVEVRTLIVWSY
jgi:signal transduction histidine kinase